MKTFVVDTAAHVETDGNHPTAHFAVECFPQLPQSLGFRQTAWRTPQSPQQYGGFILSLKTLGEYSPNPFKNTALKGVINAAQKEHK
jgi:hypothetical protein